MSKFIKFISFLLLVLSTTISYGDEITVTWSHPVLELRCRDGDYGYNGDTWQTGGAVIVSSETFDRGEDGEMTCTNDDGTYFSYPVNWENNTVTVTGWCPDGQSWVGTYVYSYILYLPGKSVRGETIENKLNVPRDAIRLEVKCILYESPLFWAAAPPRQSELASFDIASLTAPQAPAGLILIK